VPRNSNTLSVYDSDLLALYQRSLSLLSNNPQKIDVANEVNKALTRMVWYDFYHYAMEGPEAEEVPHVFDTRMNSFIPAGMLTVEPKISLQQRSKKPRNAAFEELIKFSYDGAVKSHLNKYPKDTEYFYYRIASKEKPQIALGFFRSKKRSSIGDFTNEERTLLDRLSEHLFALYRTILNHAGNSEAFRYFDSFASIGSRISHTHALSEAEQRLLPDILFGHTNDEIAERHFISVTTVKSHIKHILKKTQTKNRVDFISKFFTSPERVQW
jgi:DNA-binding CsgD family transcriptional regulator